MLSYAFRLKWVIPFMCLTQSYICPKALSCSGFQSRFLIFSGGQKGKLSLAEFRMKKFIWFTAPKSDRSSFKVFGFNQSIFPWALLFNGLIPVCGSWMRSHLVSRSANSHFPSFERIFMLSNHSKMFPISTQWSFCLSFERIIQSLIKVFVFNSPSNILSKTRWNSAGIILIRKIPWQTDRCRSLRYK